jgi:alanine racemase
MGAVSAQELPVALAARAELVAWCERFVRDVAAAAEAPVRIHVKLDTGMGRLGTRSRSDALTVAGAVAGAAPLELAATMTHFATADDDPEFLEVQRERFRALVAELRETRPGLPAHAANSAATLRDPASHFDMVRCGIAIYGCDPMHVDPGAWGLEPALELTSYVAAVKRADPGDSAGYGRRFVAERETCLATVPIGYADGIRRALTNNCEVIVGARRYPLVGTVSMDNLTLDLGSETDVRPGETAIILGIQDGVRQTAEDLARRIGTISYEVLCGISRRVPRAYHHDGEPG